MPIVAYLQHTVSNMIWFITSRLVIKWRTHMAFWKSKTAWKVRCMDNFMYEFFVISMTNILIGFDEIRVK